MTLKAKRVFDIKCDDGALLQGVEPPRRGMIFKSIFLTGGTGTFKILGKQSNGLWSVTDLAKNDESKTFVVMVRPWLAEQAAGRVTIVDPGDLTDESWNQPPFADGIELWQLVSSGSPN